MQTPLTHPCPGVCGQAEVPLWGHVWRVAPRPSLLAQVSLEPIGGVAAVRRHVALVQHHVVEIALPSGLDQGGELGEKNCVKNGLLGERTKVSANPNHVVLSVQPGRLKNPAPVVRVVVLG